MQEVSQPARQPDVAHLFLDLRDAADLVGEGFSLDAFERELLLAALSRAGGNKTRAAALLGITRRRLYSMLESSGGVPREEPDPAD